MAPLIAAGLISAGSSLIQGLMGAKSQEEQRKQQMLLEAQRQRYDSANASAQNLGNSQQRAFESLMSSYKNVLT